MAKISLIEQKSNECGLACVAMLIGKTPEEVKRIIFTEGEIKKILADEEKGFYTHCPELVKAFQKFNVSADSVGFKSWGDLNGTYIVGVKYSKKASDYFHWVIVIKDEGQEGRFIIIDPEEASIYYNGAAWVDTENGYFRRPNSNIVKVDIDVNSIDLSTILLAKNQ